METIYKSVFLTLSFHKTDELFIQNWNTSPTNLIDFKNEMLQYVSFYEKYKPKYSLWLQNNFSFNFDVKTQLWLEENINIPSLKFGNKKCAFVVSKDIFAHLCIIDSFDKLDSCIEPKHFVCEKDALNWLKEEAQIIHQNKTSNLIFDGLDDDGNIIIRLKTIDIKNTLKSLKKVVEKEKFNNLNRYKFNLLTNREKEILNWIAKGESHQKIAESLFISIHTLRTHNKNIKLKLDFKNNTEFLTFLNSFNL